MIYYDENLSQQQLMELLLKYERELNVPLEFTHLYLKLEEKEEKGYEEEESLCLIEENNRLNQLVDDYNTRNTKMECELISKTEEAEYYKKECEHKDDIISDRDNTITELSNKIYNMHNTQSNDNYNEEPLECDYDIID